MPSAAFEKFRESMHVTYEQWHDGLGYDLSALANLSSDERRQAEDLVTSRSRLDWRDIEALDSLGSQTALACMHRALESMDLTTRAEAIERLTARGAIDSEHAATVILDALDRMTLTNGMTRLLALARRFDSPVIREKLLSVALNGPRDVRAHAAATAHHLYGGTKESFDWNFRSLYLQFSARWRPTRKRALRQLCELIGIDPRRFY
jgi:hypothetical protein